MTKPGDCNWKPQPMADPIPCRVISTAATATKLATTPNKYHQAWRWWLLGSPVAKPSTFSDRMGNTQGMALRMMPPMKAKSSASHRAGSSLVAVLEVAAVGEVVAERSPVSGVIAPLAASIRKFWVWGG